MDMPRPTAEHKKLARLAGIWKGKETMYPSQWNPDGCTAEGTTTSHVALGGFCVVSDYHQKVGDKETFSGHGVYAVDHRTDGVVLFWFDSMGGGCEEFHGGWQDDVLTLTSQNPMMGTMRMTYDLKPDGTLGSAMDCSRDGETWSRLFDATYRRVD